jgi:hypothetical protein
MVAAFWLSSKQGEMADPSRFSTQKLEGTVTVGSVGEAGDIIINALAYFMKLRLSHS